MAHFSAQKTVATEQNKSNTWKRKRLEYLFTCRKDENVIQDLSVPCTSTLESRSTAEDVVSNELDNAELQHSRESLTLQLLQAQKEIARLNEE